MKLPDTHDARRRRPWIWNAPYLAAALFAVAMLLTVWSLQGRETALERNTLARDMQWAEQTARLHLNADQEFLLLLARDQLAGQLDAGGFQIRANQYIANNPQLSNVVWVDATQVVGWAAPFDTIDWIAGEPLSGAQAGVMRAALESGRPTYSPAYVDLRGHRVIELYVPVNRGREPLGAMVAAYPVDGLLHHLVPNWFAEKYRLALLGGDGAEMASNANPRPLDDQLSYAIPFDPPGQGLALRATAYRTHSTLQRFLPAGVIVALSLVLLGTLGMLTQHLRHRVRVERERDRLFNLSLDMLGIFTLDGRFVRANRAFERELGYVPDRLPGRALVEFVHGDDLALTLENLQRLENGEPVTFENRCRGADGQFKWLLWSINPVPEERLLFAVAHDVTPRRAREEALNAETAFRKAMEESTVTGLRAIDTEGRIIYANRAFCEMTGFSAEELVGRLPPFPYWPPEEAESLQRDVDTTLAGKAPRGGFELKIMRKNGERFFVRLYIAPLIDGSGRQRGWMASMNDITEPKRARAALEAANERFVTVLEGLDAAVCVAALDDGRGPARILFANRAFKTIFGFDCVGRDYWLATADCQPPREQLTRTAREIASGGTLPAELFDAELMHAQSGHWYSVHERVIRWVDGQTVRMQIAVDITDRKQMEVAQRQQQERLQRTSRLITMGEMASSLAHELNQPLAAIANYCAGCVTRMQSGIGRPEELLGAMQKASQQAERAGKIVRRVREFVKSREPNRAPADLARIIDDAVGFADIEARKVGARIDVRLAPDLPAALVDSIMIEQVALNLGKNGLEAMQATPPAHRELSVRAGMNAAGMIQVSVTDRGHGIAGRDLEQLFSAFYTTKTDGMGMGLSICRSIVEYHNGRLWAEANPRGGTVFHFTLPAVQAPVQPRQEMRA